MNRFLKNRLLVMLFVILLTIALTGCGGSAPEENPKTKRMIRPHRRKKKYLQKNCWPKV